MASQPSASQTRLPGSQQPAIFFRHACGASESLPKCLPSIKSPSTFKTSKYKDLLVLKRKEKCRLEQKNAKISQKSLSTSNGNFFDVEKSLEILNYMEIISVRQENRSTDFLEEKWLNF